MLFRSPESWGTISFDEDFTYFERALTAGNPFSRIHFNLTPDQVTTNTEYLLTFNLILLGSGGGPSLHDISFRFNGNEFHTETELANPKKVEEIIRATAVNAVVGENIIELERTGGSAASWIQFDYIEASYREAVENPNQDTDGDGQTDADETSAGTNPQDPQSNFRVLGVSPSASGLEVSWSSVAGKRYILEYSASLPANTWQTITTTDSGGATTSFTDTDSGRTQAAAGYYRMRLAN